MKISDQISCAKFLSKYYGLGLSDEDPKKLFTIDHEYIHFVKKYG